MVNDSARGNWYTVRNALPTDDGPAEILIYDEINPVFGVSAADFVKDLAAIDAPEITVRINSPGGAVFDGIAILNALRGHDAKVTTVVDGLAASIASVIAMGGDEIVMNKNSQLMVHNAWDVVIGNADDLQKAADNLRQFSANLASIYAERAGGAVSDWQAVMDAETWYTADEAVAAGLADRVSDTRPGLAAVALAAGPKAFDLSKFKHAGRDCAPAPVIAIRAQTPPPVEAEEPQGKEPTVATLKESLVEKLGLDADADDEAIVKAFEAKLEPAEPEDASDAAPVVEPSTEQITAAAAKLGLALVDKAQYEQTTAAVRELQSVRDAQVKADDERLIDDAIKAGKLAPANKSNWLALMDKDRVGIRATLAQLPAGLIPVAEMGHGMGSEEDHLDAEMASVYAKVTGTIVGKDA